MKKKRAQTFQCESLAELARQLAFSPHEHQISQLARAERLHDEMLAEPDGAYPLAYLQFRVTGLKAMNPANETLFSKAVAHDLREIIDQLSKALSLPVNPADGHVDTQTLAIQKKVATRTIARWRESGLRWRWGRLTEGGYFQVLFSAAAVAAFENANGDKVAYAAKFSQLSAEELRRLFRRAQRLAEATGAEPFTIARHIARRTGRATETLRLILLRHDLEEAPEDRIFGDYTTPLTPEQKSDLFRAWQARVRTRELTRLHKRTRATIYRVVLEKRLELLAAAARPHHFMPTLARDDAQAVFLGSPLTDFLPPSAIAGPADLPEILRPYFTAGTLPEDKENRLLLRHNYLEYRLTAQLGSISGGMPQVSTVEQAEAAAQDAQECRAAIVRLALPVVHSMANRHLPARQSPGLPPREETLLRLISLSLQVMDDAIGDFHPGSAKSSFSHYLGNRLLKRYGQLRVAPAGPADRAPLPELTAHILSRLEGLTGCATAPFVR